MYLVLSSASLNDKVVINTKFIEAVYSKESITTILLNSGSVVKVEQTVEEIYDAINME